jgi:hypothetical protein
MMSIKIWQQLMLSCSQWICMISPRIVIAASVPPICGRTHMWFLLVQQQVMVRSQIVMMLMIHNCVVAMLNISSSPWVISSRIGIAARGDIAAGSAAAPMVQIIMWPHMMISYRIMTRMTTTAWHSRMILLLLQTL